MSKLECNAERKSGSERGPMQRMGSRRRKTWHQIKEEGGRVGGDDDVDDTQLEEISFSSSYSSGSTVAISLLSWVIVHNPVLSCLALPPPVRL